jgi:uncharacterized tellurite resistance protein B-like protein
MSLISRLLAAIAPAAPARGSPALDEGRLAATALLVHIARVDGAMSASERQRLEDLFVTRLGLDRDDALALLARGEDRSAGRPDIADLVEEAARSAGEEERRNLLAMAYAVARADGTVAEFEDDLIWRLGRLLGFDDAAITAVKAGESAR